MSSLEVTDRESAAVAVAPRVTLNDIEAAIALRYDMTAMRAALKLIPEREAQDIDVTPLIHGLERVSICLLVMKNGFVIIGKCAPASPENLNRELGKKFAYEDAVRQVWPLMGFALRDQLAAG